MPARAQVNSPRQRTGILRGIIRDPNVPTKLEVGPRFLPSSFYGDYW